MAERISLLRALVLLSSLAVLLVALVLIGGLTMDQSSSVEPTAFCGTKMNVNTQGKPLSESQLRGKTLFKQNCATCHNRNMVDDMTGPALAGVTQRWAAYDQADLYSWIRNSLALVEAKHPRASEIYKQWGGSNMTSFPNLTATDIEDILAFVEK